MVMLDCEHLLGVTLCHAEQLVVVKFGDSNGHDINPQFVCLGSSLGGGYFAVCLSVSHNDQHFGGASARVRKKIVHDILNGLSGVRVSCVPLHFIHCSLNLLEGITFGDRQIDRWDTL